MPFQISTIISYFPCWKIYWLWRLYWVEILVRALSALKRPGISAPGRSREPVLQIFNRLRKEYGCGPEDVENFVCENLSQNFDRKILRGIFFWKIEWGYFRNFVSETLKILMMLKIFTDSDLKLSWGHSGAKLHVTLTLCEKRQIHDWKHLQRLYFCIEIGLDFQTFFSTNDFRRY